MKKILPWVLTGLVIGLYACEKNQYDELGPNKSNWSNENFNGTGGNNDPGDDPGDDPVTKESSIDVSFYSSSFSRPTDLEIETRSFPVITEHTFNNVTYERFYFLAKGNKFSLMISVPKGYGLFGPGQTLDLSSIAAFEYSIRVQYDARISSSKSDIHLDYVRLEFYEYGPDEISGNFTIKTWSNAGSSGLSEEHHNISFTLYPTENHQLFD